MRENDSLDNIFSYLSENDFLPSSRAAEEDTLHAWASKFIRAEDMDREVNIARAEGAVTDSAPCTENYDKALQAALAWADKTGENMKYHKILHCRFSRLYFFTLSRMPAHYRDGSDLKFGTVNARHDYDMGVSLARYTIFIYTTDFGLS